MYQLIHGHTDFPNLPVTFREKFHALKNLNERRLGQNKLLCALFLPPLLLCGTILPLTRLFYSIYPSFKRIIIAKLKRTEAELLVEQEL